MSGTSMATPAVAGVLACLVERFNEEPDSRFIAESVLKDAGTLKGSITTMWDVGMSLPLVEAYLGDATAVNLAGKKRRKTEKNFFRDSILKSGDCSDERIYTMFFIDQMEHTNSASPVETTGRRMSVET